VELYDVEGQMDPLLLIGGLYLLGFARTQDFAKQNTLAFIMPELDIEVSCIIFERIFGVIVVFLCYWMECCWLSSHSSDEFSQMH
jgi:hypothetical protein